MRTNLEILGAAVLLVAGVIYWHFGTLSPCGVLRETVRQRDGLAAVLPIASLIGVSRLNTERCRPVVASRC